MAGELGASHRDPHARAGLRDGADEMAADKARAPVDGHERLVVENDGHLCPLAPRALPPHYTRGPNPVKRREPRAWRPRLGLALIDFRKPGSYLRASCPGGGTGRRARFRF